MSHSVAAAEAVGRLDVQSPEFIQCPYPVYAAVQKAAPVAEVASGLFVVTGREYVEQMLRDHHRFTSRRNLDGAFKFTADVQSVLDDSLFFHGALFNVEPPKHTAFRGLIGQTFTPRNLRKREPAIRHLAQKLADDLLQKIDVEGTADLVSSFAYPLPMTVICDIIGVPGDDRAMVKQWNDAWLALQVVPLEPSQQLACAQTVVLYERYIKELLIERRRHPTGDLLSTLALASQAKEPGCTIEDAIVALRVMLAAGHETTTNLIANTALHLLSDHTLWEAIGANPARAAQAVEEGLRFDSSVQGAPRHTSEDVVLGGVRIPSGSRVQAMLAAVGRDPEWIDEPDVFQLHRAIPPRHHGFGYGIHFCPGAPLARLEASAALACLANIGPDLIIAPNHEVAYHPGGFVFRALTALPLRRGSRSA